MHNKNTTDNNTHLILAHGWGYTPQVFDPLLHTWDTKKIATITIQALDQGYYTHPAASLSTWHPKTQTWQTCEQDTPHTHPNTQYIGIGHSLGFSKLLQLPLPWTQLISINGFTRFPQSRALRRMINRAQHNIHTVLQDFHQQCGTPSPPSDHANPSTLLNDLTLLQHLNTQAALETHHQQSTHIIHIATQQDSIISPTDSTACFTPLSKSNIQLHQQDGTHSDLYITPTRYTWLFEHIQRSTPL